MKKLILLFAAALGSVSSVLAQASPLGGVSCPNGYDSSPVFTYTGATETFTVPAGVTSIHITAYAPTGGDGLNNGTVTPLGGYGGYVQGFLSVTPGEVLYITIGQRGQNAVATGNANPINAFNGGGSGGYSAAGGSGATDIRRGGAALANRIMVAGGGGGAGSNGCSGTAGSGYNPYGGAGGNADATGANGENGTFNGSLITGGRAGIIGGAASPGVGCFTYPGSAGNVNGNGGIGPSYNVCLAGGRLGNGGGGGGGYTQGGGGGSGALGTNSCSGSVSSAGGGGAGGANYISSDFTNTTIASTGFTQGGVVICTASPVVTPVVTNISYGGIPCVGTLTGLTVTGTLGSASDWAWYYNGVFQNYGSTFIFTIPNASSALIQVRGEGGNVGTSASFYDYTMPFYANPIVNVTPSSGTYCGDVTQVANGGATYLWSNGNTSASNTVTAPNLQSQNVTVTDSNGCTASTTTNVFAYPAVFVSASFDSSTGALVATPSGGNGNYTYQWSFLGNPIPGATGPIYTPTDNGFYAVLVTDTDGVCSSNSTVIISNVGVDNINTSTLTMSPNPTTGVLVLNNLTIGKNFRLINTLGQLVQSFEATSTQMTLDITAQPAGTYFLQSEGQALAIVKQ